jgi:hypothetical protein
VVPLELEPGEVEQERAGADLVGGFEVLDRVGATTTSPAA